MQSAANAPERVTRTRGDQGVEFRGVGCFIPDYPDAGAMDMLGDLQPLDVEPGGVGDAAAILGDIGRVIPPAVAEVERVPFARRHAARTRRKPVDEPLARNHRGSENLDRRHGSRRCSICSAVSEIDVDHLSKHYKVHRRPPGVAAALRSLFKRKYETVKAVEDLSFSIEPGERVGFLGPNGAGKTTTLKVLSGLLHPTTGSVKVAGHTPQRREIPFLKKITLVMGQKQQLLWDLPPVETFALNRAIYEVPKKQFDDTLAELTKLLDLEKLVTKPTRQLSLGERMKCELAAALLHTPRVLFLDEPTIGLDVSMQAAMRDFIKRYNETRGATVILTSHYMVDVVALCPRVIVIDKGTLRYDGDLKSLVKRVNPDKLVTLKYSTPVERGDLARFGDVVAFSDTQAQVKVSQARVREVAAALAHLPILDLTVEDPPLEEVMRQLFAQSDSETPSASAERVGA